MQELRENIERVADKTAFDPQGTLRDTAQKWAHHAIETYRDELLEKALKISEALTNFLAEMENPK